MNKKNNEQSAFKDDFAASSNVDPSAWLNEHGNYLFRFALLRIKHKETCEDLVQDTLLSAIKNIEHFKAKSSVRTWLTSILKNKILDYYRSSKFKSEISSDDDEIKVYAERDFNKLGIWNTILSDWAKSPEKHLENKQFYIELENCLSKLAHNARKLFVLKNIDNIAADEICKVFDISASNLWVTMHRSRMALRDCIEKNWINSNN